MEVDQTQSFNQKLSQWIASQGFWFQLRHSMSGGGGWAMTLSHLLRLGFKVLIALLVAAAGFAFYLVKRVDSEAFLTTMDAGVKEGLGAKEAKLVDFTRIQGDAQIRRLGAEGGESSFFRSLDVGNIRFRMGLLDGVTGEWNAGTLAAKWLEADLKAGANSPAEAAAIGEAIFKQWPGFRFSSVEVEDTTLTWGYYYRANATSPAKNTRGKIEHSRMAATRSPEGWTFSFTGGTFTQNWLKNLEIVELVLECVPGSLTVKKGIFKCGGGSVTFRDMMVDGGEKPAFSGRVEVSRVAIAQLLPEALSSFMEGTISGEFTLTGSTNAATGIGLEGDVTLGGGNAISLRERFHLLKALSVVDVYNSYRKVDLNRGSFHVKTSGGVLELSRVDLKADELMTLQGRLLVRPPNEQEMAGGVGEETAESFNPIFSDPEPELSDGEGSGEISLKRAAQGGSKEQEEGRDMAIFGRRAQEKIDRQLNREALARESQMLRYEGGFRITIPGDAFERSEVLRNAFPVDPDNGRIPMDVPIQGTIYEITRRQAEEILEIGTKR